MRKQREGRRAKSKREGGESRGTGRKRLSNFAPCTLVLWAYLRAVGEKVVASPKINSPQIHH